MAFLLESEFPSLAPSLFGGIIVLHVTLWPWLIGPFVEAWVRVRGGTSKVRREARERFLAGPEAHLAVAGLGHISEIADGSPSHVPRGCPFQAWSLGEYLRLKNDVLVDKPRPRGGSNATRTKANCRK